jgi:chemotaxis signal transduction protein
MLLCAECRDIGLAVDQIEGYLRFSSTDVRPHGNAEVSEHIQEVLQLEGTLRGIIGIRSLMEAVQRRAHMGRELVKGHP